MNEKDPEQIRREIEQTRRSLSDNVNELGQSVSPGNIAERQKRKFKDKANDLKAKVMGSSDDDPVRGYSGGAYGEYGYDTSGSSSSGLQDAAQAVQDLPDQAIRKTQGNPMAAGLIALGAGWLLGSLLPASRPEQQASQQLKDAAEPVVEKAKEVGQEMGDHLKQPAQEAVESVKSQAQASAETVKADGQLAAEKVKGSAEQAKQDVQDR